MHAWHRASRRIRVLRCDRRYLDPRRPARVLLFIVGMNGFAHPAPAFWLCSPDSLPNLRPMVSDSDPALQHHVQNLHILPDSAMATRPLQPYLRSRHSNGECPSPKRK